MSKYGFIYLFTFSFLLVVMLPSSLLNINVWNVFIELFRPVMVVSRSISSSFRWLCCLFFRFVRLSCTLYLAQFLSFKIFLHSSSNHVLYIIILFCYCLVNGLPGVVYVFGPASNGLTTRSMYEYLLLVVSSFISILFHFCNRRLSFFHRKLKDRQMNE